ncbi:MAG: hypothetical protein AB1782_11175 [Cyanobacteriota bacterium]
MADNISKIIYDKKQKFSCSNCPDICCKSFSIKVDKSYRNRLIELEEIKEILKSKNKEFHKTDNNNYYLPSEYVSCENRCIFLHNEKHCIIHRNYGYENKPLDCMTYPFSLYLDANENVHIEVSYKCKSIIENYGANLEDIKDQITSQLINKEYYPEKYPLYDYCLEQGEIFKLAQKLKETINNTDYDIYESILNYVVLLSKFKEHYYKTRDFDKFLNNYHVCFDMNIYSQANNNVYRYINSLNLTNVLIYSTYNRNNPLFKDVFKLSTIFIAYYVSIFSLSNKFKLYNSDKTLNLKKLPSIDFSLDKRSDELIRRYLSSCIIRHKYLTIENKDLNFFNKVIIMFSMIRIYSKIDSLLFNNEKIIYENVLNAISQVEFVYYHTNFKDIPVMSFHKVINAFINNQISSPGTAYNVVYKGLS